jgi:hypothetical protein
MVVATAVVEAVRLIPDLPDNWAGRQRHPRLDEHPY